jgi:hypothetical protein
MAENILTGCSIPPDYNADYNSGNVPGDVSGHVFNLSGINRRIRAVDEVLSDLARSDGVLCYADDVMHVYKWKDRLYILPSLAETDLPPEITENTEDQCQEPSSFEDALDRAVIEAGFATEPLRHALHELYECLYVRMLADGMKGFTQREYDAVLNAKELVGLT